MSEMEAKLAKLAATHDAIERSREALKTCPAGERVARAATIRRLQDQAKALRSTIPKPKLIWSRP